MAGPSVAVRAASATPRGSPHAEPEPRGTKDQEPKARIVSSARPRRWRCGYDISTSGAWAEEQRPDPAGLVPFAWRAPLGTPAGAGEEAQEKGPLWSHNGGLCERGVSIAQRCLLHPTPPPPEAVAPVLIHSQQQNNLPPGYLPLGTSLQNAVAKEGLPLDTAPKVHSCTLCIHEHISTRVC